MRSGTTFFRNLLSSNRRIQVVGSEMNRFWTEVGRAPCGTVPCCPSRSASDAVEVRDRVRRAFELFYRRRNHPMQLVYRGYRKIRYVNETILKRGEPFFILNKSTHLMNKIGYLRAIFPEARFIILVRDIHSQACSLRKHFRRIAERRGLIPEYRPGTGECWSFSKGGRCAAWEESFDSIPLAWMDLHIQAWTAQRDSGAERVRWIGYEELCRDPLAVLADLEPFLGIPLNRRVNCKFVNTSGRDPMHAWARELSAEERAIIERVISDRRADYERIMQAVSSS